MYPAALNKIASQTNDSSRVFRKMDSPKATRISQQNDKKLEQIKDNQRSGRGLSQTSPLFSILILVVKHNFVYITIIFLNSHLAYRLYYTIMNLGKNLKHFKTVFIKILTIHFAKLQLQMLKCPVAKQFCLAFCRAKCGLVIERVIHISSSTRSWTLLLDSQYHQSFPLLYLLNCQNILHFSPLLPK